MVRGRQRYSVEPLARRTEAHAGRDPDGDFVQHLERELERGVSLGNRRPNVEAGLRGSDLHADLAQGGDHQIAPPLVDHVPLFHERLVARERRDAGVLDRLEDAAVDIRLHLAEGGDGRRVSDHHPDAPAGHVVALGEGVELDPNLLGPGHLKEALRAVTVVAHLRIGVVVAHENVVLRCEVDHLLEEAVGSHRAGRVVGVADPHQLGPAHDVRGDRVQVGQEVVGRRQRHQVGLAAGEQGTDGVDGVAGVRDQRHVAGIEERERDVRHAFLGADEGHHLVVRVELHPEPIEVPGGDSAPELRQSVVVWVAVVLRDLGGAVQLVQDPPRRREIGVPYPEADHVEAGGALGRDLSVRLRKQVGRQACYAVSRLEYPGSRFFHCYHRVNVLHLSY